MTMSRDTLYVYIFSDVVSSIEPSIEDGENSDERDEGNM